MSHKSNKNVPVPLMNLQLNPSAVKRKHEHKHHNIKKFKTNKENKVTGLVPPSVKKCHDHPLKSSTYPRSPEDCLKMVQQRIAENLNDRSCWSRPFSTKSSKLVQTLKPNQSYLRLH